VQWVSVKNKTITVPDGRCRVPATAFGKQSTKGGFAGPLLSEERRTRAANCGHTVAKEPCPVRGLFWVWSFLLLISIYCGYQIIAETHLNKEPASMIPGMRPAATDRLH
jgi:hypothetical protein